MKILFFITFLTVFFPELSHQECNAVQIKMLNKPSSTYPYLEISVKAGIKENLKLPGKENLIVGYRQDEDADCYFEVFDVIAKREVLPTGDYQYFPQKNKEMQNVSIGDSIIYQSDFLRLYNLDLKKKYRLRVIFKLSNYNLTNDVFSNWIVIGQGV